MLQLNESIDLTDKMKDKIAQMEIRNRRKFTPREKDIAYEMFFSGFLFSQQWNGNTFTNKEE